MFFEELGIRRWHFLKLKCVLLHLAKDLKIDEIRVRVILAVDEIFKFVWSVNLGKIKGIKISFPAFFPPVGFKFIENNAEKLKRAIMTLWKNSI